MLFREANYKSVSDEKNKENVSLRADTSFVPTDFKEKLSSFLLCLKLAQHRLLFQKDYLSAFKINDSFYSFINVTHVTHSFS